MNRRKVDVITFKVDRELTDRLRQIPNRSGFIRSAILFALDAACPLCNGSGVLTSDQKKHWRSFSQHHDLVECKRCGAVHLTCSTTAGMNTPHKNSSREHQS
ncbi:CopG family transcriptional regulator [bacterium]|nr:CopG family transcriptional regulator [candidate division CSSED10-310 bacterium]